MSYSHGLIIVSLASICRKLNENQFLTTLFGWSVFSAILTFAFLEWLLAGYLNFQPLDVVSRGHYHFLPDNIFIYYWAYNMQTHSSVSVNMTGLVRNVLCFLFSYYETSFVIFLNLMICGRLQGVSCKQTIFDYVIQLKKYHVTLFLYLDELIYWYLAKHLCGCELLVSFA